MTPHLKIVALELLKKGVCDSYSLHVKYRLTPFQVQDAFGDLHGLGICNLEGSRIVITDSGLSKMFEKRFALFSNKGWKVVPDYWARPKEDAGVQHLPVYSLVDRSLLKMSK